MTKTTTQPLNSSAHILTEDCIGLSSVPELLVTRPHIATVWRWVHRGVRGTKLEAYKIAGKTVTSKQAVHRFLEATQS